MTTRSPAYPTISLAKAVKHITKLHAQMMGNKEIPYDTAMGYLGYSKNCGEGNGVLSTIWKFGLLDRDGHCDSRLVKLSFLGLQIIQGIPAERANALRRAAEHPHLHFIMLKRYGFNIPSSTVAQLVAEYKFTEFGANRFVQVYNETMAFAKMAVPPLVTTAPPRADARSSVDVAPCKANPRGVTVSVPEGEIIIRFPRHLSAESINDVEEWMNMLLLHARRELAGRKVKP